MVVRVDWYVCLLRFVECANPSLDRQFSHALRIIRCKHSNTVAKTSTPSQTLQHYCRWWPRHFDAETLILDPETDTGVFVRPKAYRTLLMDQVRPQPQPCCLLVLMRLRVYLCYRTCIYAPKRELVSLTEVSLAHAFHRFNVMLDWHSACVSVSLIMYTSICVLCIFVHICRAISLT